VHVAGGHGVPSDGARSLSCVPHAGTQLASAPDVARRGDVVRWAGWKTGLWLPAGAGSFELPSLWVVLSILCEPVTW
jgi:hypothetical protein